MDKKLYGCIEAGGTKFVCAVGGSPETLSARKIIPTTDPASTLADVVEYFRAMEAKHGRLAGFGIASFGPADINPDSPQWGTILKTAKPGWSNIDICGHIADAFGVPVNFDTDVNGAALAEARWGAAKSAGMAAYVTVGTGIGAGITVNGQAIHGRRHPEAGHIIPRRHSADSFAGICRFHGDCLEGLASGPAIERRWGTTLSLLPPDHIAHDVVAWYLGQLAVTLIATTSAQAVIFGGGVLRTPGLVERIRAVATALNADYFCESGEIARIIGSPALGETAGILGALLLAQRTENGF